MFIQFDTPHGVSSESARDAIVERLDKIAEAVHRGQMQGVILGHNGEKIGAWVVGSAVMPHLQENPQRVSR